MSASDDNLSIFFCDIPPIYLIPSFASLGTPLPLTVRAPALGLANRRMRSSLDIRPSKQVGTELELLSVHLREEAYSLLGQASNTNSHPQILVKVT